MANITCTITYRDSPFHNCVAGGVGGVFSLLVGHPFDTVKVNLQAVKISQESNYNGAVDCAKKILQDEGIQGLYRGMSSLLLSAVPRFALLFYGNALGKVLIADSKRESKSKSSRSNNEIIAKLKTTSDLNLGYSEIFLAGSFAQLFTVPIIVAPVERIKVLLQTNHGHRHDAKFSGQRDCLRFVYEKEGIRGIYKGTLLTFCRDMPSFGFYFLTYEYLRNQYKTYVNSSNLSTVGTIVCGGLSGIAGWCIAIPVDTVKNCFQASMTNASTFDIICNLYQEDGLAGFVRGYRPILLRAFPANAAAFLGYEYCLNIMESMNT